MTKTKQPLLVAMDLEGCLVPEIWLNLSQSTGIAELSLTTRDIADYDQLMQKRLKTIEAHDLRISDIQAVIAKLEPLAGAREFLDWLRSCIPVIILSDTFYEFADPLMQKLGYPALFCHTLSVDQEGRVKDYHLRSPDSKAQAVDGFKKNGFWVTAIGDSYNDIQMLMAAHQGILLHAPEKISNDFSQLSRCKNYGDLKKEISLILAPKV